MFNPFKNIKKSVIRKRVIAFLTSSSYTLGANGCKTVSSKIADAYRLIVNATFQSLIEPISKVDPETVADMVAEAHEPVMALIKIFKDNKPFFQALEDDINDSFDSYVKDMDNITEDVTKDVKDISELFTKGYTEHINVEDEDSGFYKRNRATE